MMTTAAKVGQRAKARARSRLRFLGMPRKHLRLAQCDADSQPCNGLQLSCMVLPPPRTNA